MLSPANTRQSSQSVQPPEDNEEALLKAFQRDCQAVSGEPVTSDSPSGVLLEEVSLKSRVASPFTGDSGSQEISDEELIFAFKKGLTREQVKAFFPLPDQSQGAALSIDRLERLLHHSQATGYTAVTDEVAKNLQSVLEGLMECLKSMLRQEVPEVFPDMSQLPLGCTMDLAVMVRTIFTKHLNMWGVVDKAWASKLAAEIGDMKCLEIFAGDGWLSKALSEAGVKVTATDICPKSPVCQVLDQDAVTAVKDHDYDCIILSWPHPDNSAAMEEAIRALKPGTKIVYVGHRQPDPHEVGVIATPQGMKEVRQIKVMPKPQWPFPGIEEQVYLLERV